MTSRRDFIQQGALWVAGAALIEPKRLWAFPVNPAARMSNEEYLAALLAPSMKAWEYQWRLKQAFYSGQRLRAEVERAVFGRVVSPSLMEIWP